MNTLKIFKYKLDHETRAGVVAVPQRSAILSAGLDPKDDICIWAGVNPNIVEVQDIPYVLVFTGEQPPFWPFLGTVRKGELMYHVFLKTPDPL